MALANKETLVVAGPVLRREIGEAGGCELLPVDSEHSAIWQSFGTDLPCRRAAERCRRIVLTASGGPFRDWSAERLRDATPADALNHPTWDMGAKITIDSATMMNKALEIIEARWLFDVPADAIEAVIHPQSIIHSMVELHDGSVVSQMSPPDMRMPIQLALTHPRRVAGIASTLDRGERHELTLQPVDRERFPAVELGFEVAAAGGTAGAVVNAANEVAVRRFLDDEIRFTDIVPTCRRVLEQHTFEADPTLDRLIELDRWSRGEAAAS